MYILYFFNYYYGDVKMEARDFIALAVVVGSFIALIFKSLSTEDFMAIILAILGYYFGYKHGFERGVSNEKR
jgi:hypothetical protein